MTNNTSDSDLTGANVVQADEGQFRLNVLRGSGFVVGAVSLILEFGMQRPAPVNPSETPGLVFSVFMLHFLRYLAMTGYILSDFWRLIGLSDRSYYLKNNFIQILLSLGAAFGIFTQISLGRSMMLSSTQKNLLDIGLVTYLIIMLITDYYRFVRFTVNRQSDPVRKVLIIGLIIIISSSLILSLPCASYADRFSDFGNNFLGHVFASASSITLTGLSVWNISQHYSAFGQIVLLILMQIGGIGIILLGMTVLLRITAPNNSIRFDRLAIRVVLVTIFLELIGSVFLFDLCDTAGPWQKTFMSAFHSVSALLNAGIVLTEDSLITTRNQWQNFAVILPLMILGGLGFPFLHRVLRQKEFSLINTIVLRYSFVLLIIGTLLIFFIESVPSQNRWGREKQYEDIAVRSDENVLRNKPAIPRLIDSFFLSASARGNGFTLDDISSGKLHPATYLILAALMSIGGGIASPVGGMSIVTLALAASACRNRFKNQNEITVFHRKVSSSVLMQGFIILMFYLMLLGLVLFSLTLTHPQIGILDLLMESASAVSTTNLSTGVTQYLNLWGRIIVIVGMISGRILPIGLLYYLNREESQNAGWNNFRYA